MLSASEPGRSASPESPTEGEGLRRQASGHHSVSDVYQLGIHPSCSNQLIHDGRRVTPCSKRLQVDIGWRLPQFPSTVDASWLGGLAGGRLDELAAWGERRLGGEKADQPSRMSDGHRPVDLTGSRSKIATADRLVY